MIIKNNKNLIFRGGIWIGAWATSWPFCRLEVNQDSLSLYDEMLGRDLVLLRSDIIRIEVKKYIPVIGYGIKVQHAKKDYDSIAYFWYVSFHFNKLISALKEFNWLK